VRSSRLARAFYYHPTLTVARELLGKVLVQRSPWESAAGMLVETEAYIAECDPRRHKARRLVMPRSMVALAWSMST
jgi:DNA-3-methyladenine glycosylase